MIYYNNLSDLYFLKNDFDKAKKYAPKTIELLPYIKNKERYLQN